MVTFEKIEERISAVAEEWTNYNQVENAELV